DAARAPVGEVVEVALAHAEDALAGVQPHVALAVLDEAVHVARVEPVAGGQGGEAVVLEAVQPLARGDPEGVLAIEVQRLDARAGQPVAIGEDLELEAGPARADAREAALRAHP